MLIIATLLQYMYMHVRVYFSTGGGGGGGGGGKTDEYFAIEGGLGLNLKTFSRGGQIPPKRNPACTKLCFLSVGKEMEEQAKSASVLC